MPQYTFPSLKLETPQLFPKQTPQLSGLQFPTPQLKSPQTQLMPGALGKQQIQETKNLSYSNKNGTSSSPKPSLGSSVAAAGINAVSSQLTQMASDKIFGDSELGRGMGTLFSSGVSSAANTMGNNILKGAALGEGLAQNAGASLAGAGVGLAANYVGQGITSAMGDSRLGRAVGAGFATGAGTIGGNAAAKALGVAAGSINPYALGAQVLGSALGAATGPSKEYGGKYGKITQGMDMAYDALSIGANFIPGAGQIISGAMVLNKGLSNIFGSTDGMCVCAGTKVYTAKGKLINIEDLKQEDGIIGWNEITHEIRPNTIKGIIEPRKKECLRIILDNGIKLDCSIDHPILSNVKERAETHRINGKRIAYRDWSFRRADELKVGNWVGLANNIDYWGDKEMPNAYLVGMLIGDGTYTYESSCKLWTADPSTWKYLEENNLAVLIKQYTPENSNGKYQVENRDYRIINGMQLVKDLGIAYQSGSDKTLPRNIQDYNRDSICKLIAGLFDTDGSISANKEKGTCSITLYQSNLKLLQKIRVLLYKLGIYSVIGKRKASVNRLKNGKTINSNESYRLELTDRKSILNFNKFIPINIDYKKENLQTACDIVYNKLDKDHSDLSGAKQVKIVSIKKLGIQTVYNLEAAEDHTYLANNIITHNTKTDAILGSAFMPAPVKWLNMAGASKTGTFNDQSWQKSEKTNAFMQNAFGNLGDKFDKAREEAGKTYGTFSHGAKRRAQENIDFANMAWRKVNQMADQNEIQNIRSQYMSSINNQRYAQDIQGGWSPMARGKMGMKILNNATNHNVGMRLLSGAALIDNKQMILSRCRDLD